MLDLLIDLMVTVNAIDKSYSLEDKQRQIHGAHNSLKAIENRLRRMEFELRQALPENTENN